MRARLETLLTDTWYGGRQPGPLLRTLERLYRPLQAAQRRRELSARAGDLEGAPIVVVGNLTAGGSGKTPLVIRLCQLLSGVGIRPGVVSRGYGRTSREPLRVNEQHGAGEAGDEPLLVFRRCAVPVQVGPDRVESARRLFADGVDVVISDDGLQRLRLPRAMEICVVDGEQGFGNGRLLPAGPLREPVGRLETVDHVLCNGTGEAAAGLQGCIAMRLEPADAISVEGSARMSLEDLARQSREQPVHAVAGIGNPGRFFSLLSGLGIRAHDHPFPDHHRYEAGDFEGLGDGLLLMTEKDAVKCRGFGLDDAWCLPVEARLPAAWEDEMMVAIRELLE